MTKWDLIANIAESIAAAIVYGASIGLIRHMRRRHLLKNPSKSVMAKFL